jgi:hypothetical protein
MTPSETTRINRLLGLTAMVAGLMAIALPGESATGSTTREATVAFEPSAEEAGDSLTTQLVPQPVADSTEATARPDSSRVGRAPFYGGNPIPLVQPRRAVQHRRPAPNQAAVADSTTADSTKAESRMEGLVCFQ